MSEEYEMICFQIISNSGAAKSNYVEAIKKAKVGSYAEAEALMKEAEQYFVEAHRVHVDMIQKEAGGEETTFSLILMHAEDQMASVEMAKLMAEEIIDLHKKLDKLS